MMNDNLQPENKQIIIAKPWEELACDNCKHCVDDDMCTAYPLEFSLGYCPTIINCREHIKRPENEDFNNIISEIAELKERLEKAFELPCKVGDTVYMIDNDRFSAVIEELEITDEGIAFIWAQYDKSPELTEVWDEGSFMLEDIGKTVFLSPEEAEAAKERIEK